MLPKQTSLLRITTAGSVDDGKSTLIGRLLYESHAILDDQLEALQKQKRIGGALDLSLVTDGLKSEREQGITIDVAYKYFSSSHRKFILADAPGHVQYTRNMVTAASRADAAILLVDARLGIQEQTRRHAYLVHLLRVPHIVLAINKIDLIDYDQGRIAAIEREFRDLAFTRSAASLHVIPVSALTGDNISERSRYTPWYEGPTLVAILDTLPSDSKERASPLLPVQWIVRDPGGRRYASGSLTQGKLSVGDRVQILPSRQESVVADLWVAGARALHAEAGEAVAVALADERDLERGSLLVSPTENLRPTRDFTAHLVWFDDEPLRKEERYLLRLGTQSSRVSLAAVSYRFDLQTLSQEPAPTVVRNDIVHVVLQSAKALYLEPFAEQKEAGSFILIDPLSFRTVAAGMVEEARGGEAHPGSEGGLILVDALQKGSLESAEKILQLPAAFLTNNSPRTQQRIVETLLDLGWSVRLERGEGAEALRKSMQARGFGSHEDGSGI